MKENRFFKGMVKTSSLVLCIVIMICSVASLFSVSAAASYKGSGTKADPYLVETVEQLQDIKYNLSAHYKLANTIDLSSVSNFTPIGNLETPFTGTFTCELNSDKTPKYIIKNLKISVEETKDIGEKLNRWECALFGAADGAIFSGIYVFDVKLSNKNFGDNTGAVVYGVIYFLSRLLCLFFAHFFLANITNHIFTIVIFYFKIYHSRACAGSSK